MVAFILPANSATGGYEIDNSLRTGGGDNHHLSMVYGSSASNRKTFTFSSWFKLGQAAHFTEYYDDEKYLFTSTDAAQSTTNVGYGGYTSGNAGGFHFQDGRSGTYIETTSKFRDPSAWYHVVVRYDSTQSTASDRIFIYVNGVSQPLNYSNSGDPEVDLNTEVDFFLAGDNIDATSADSGNFVHNVNSYYNSGFGAANNSFDGHFADMYLINAQSLAPTEFAETNDNGVWIPKKYGGTFNSHSFHLEFKQTGSSANSSGIGADTSGQDNHFKVGVNSTLAAVDITTDTPTNNWCTLNSVDKDGHTNAEGNLQVSGNVIYGMQRGTMGASSGKWYFEARVDTAQNDTAIALANEDENVFTRFTGETTNSVGYLADGRFFYNSSATTYSSLSGGDIFQMAFDADSGKIWIGKNNTWQNSGDPANGSGQVQTVSWNFFLPAARTVSNGVLSFNFGNPSFSISSGNANANGFGNFEFAVPSGFFALCTKNLAEYG